jgi:hypothetical protein
MKVMAPVGQASGAGRLAAAQVALLNLAGLLHVVDGAEGAGNGADLATHAGRLVDDLGAGGLVDGDRLHRAGVQAPGLVALRAGIGHFLAGVMEFKDLDTRLGRRVRAVVLERTGHLALHAARAFVCVDMQHLLHVSLLWVAAPMKRLAYEWECIAIVGSLPPRKPSIYP